MFLDSPSTVTKKNLDHRSEGGQRKHRIRYEGQKHSSLIDCLLGSSGKSKKNRVLGLRGSEGQFVAAFKKATNAKRALHIFGSTCH